MMNKIRDLSAPVFAVAWCAVVLVGIIWLSSEKKPVPVTSESIKAEDVGRGAGGRAAGFIDGFNEGWKQRKKQ